MEISASARMPAASQSHETAKPKILKPENAESGHAGGNNKIIRCC